jgi:hypothetical protein
MLGARNSAYASMHYRECTSSRMQWGLYSRHVTIKCPPLEAGNALEKYGGYGYVELARDQKRNIVPLDVVVALHYRLMVR